MVGINPANWPTESDRLQIANEEVKRMAAELTRLRAEVERLRSAATNLMAAIDNMHARGETFTARVSIAASDMNAALAAGGKGE